MVSKKHFRIAALQNNFRQQSEEMKVLEVWKQFNFDTEQFFHVCADCVTSVYDAALHHDRVKQYLDKSKKLGIGTIFYMNCHILNPADSGRREEWAVRNPDGSYRIFYSTYYATCVASSWKEHFFEAVRSLREFELEGLFFDGPIWGVPCYCPVCRKKFQEQFGKAMEEASKKELDDFNYSVVNTFKKELRQVVLETNPSWKMYFNEALFSGRFNAEKMAEQLSRNDIIGTEYGGFFGHDPLRETIVQPRTEEGSKLAKSIAGDRPAVIFFAGDAKPWSWSMHTSAEIRLTYATVLANGASVWFGLHNDPSFLVGEHEEVLAEMTAFDCNHSDVYADMQSMAEIAVFYSFNTVSQYSHTAVESDLYNDTSRQNVHPGNYTEYHIGAEMMLSSLHIPWDFVTELTPEKFSRYKVIFAPALAFLSTEIERALESFVRNGGILVADGEFGFFSEKGQRREVTAAETIGGIRPSGKIVTIDPWNAFAFDNKYRDNASSPHLLPMVEYQIEVEKILPEVTSAAKMCPPMKGRYSEKPEKPQSPFIFQRRLGKGKIIYIAGCYFNFYFHFRYPELRDGLMKIIEEDCSFAFRLELPEEGRLCFTVSATPAGTVIHLVNQTFPSCPVEHVTPIHGIILHVPNAYSSAVSLHSGEKLNECSPFSFKLSVLKDFDVILLTKQQN